MPIPVVPEDRAPIHASLDDMHRNAGQFQTRLTRHGGPPVQELRRQPDGSDTAPPPDVTARACMTGPLNYLRPFLPPFAALSAIYKAKMRRFTGVRTAHQRRMPSPAE